MKRPDVFDEKVLSDIFDEMYTPIYRYIYYHTGHVETAQDLTGEAFSRFLDQIKERETPPDDYRRWLFRVARNLVIDERRRMMHRDHLALNEDIVALAIEVEVEAERKIEVERVLRILQDMPPNQATTIILRYLHGMPHNEIASILNLTVGAVKALQHRALQHLRDCLAGQSIILFL